MEAADPAAAAPEVPIAVNTDDLRLAEAVLRKDRKATAEFVDQHSDAVYNYLRNRLFPRVDLAEDILQDVFLAAWESLARYEGRASLKNWMIGIARHKVESHYRARLKEHDPLPDGVDEEVSDPMAGASLEESLDRDLLHEKARKILEILPEDYRIALLWRYWERRSAQDMADQTGKTVKAVERLLSRARQQFRRRWNDD